MFASDEPMIADECFNFIAAATQASSTTIGNMIAYLHFNASKDTKAKLYKEIDTCLAGVKDPIKELTLDKIESLDFLKSCWMESLRMEAPIPISTSHLFIEDV